MDSLAIRSVTLRRFAQWNFIPLEGLPLLEAERELRPKSPAQAAQRACAAVYVAALCFGAPADLLRRDLERFGLWSHLTHNEQQLFTSSSVGSRARAENSWLVESVQFLAWALCLTDLNHLAPCEETLAALLPRPKDPSDFVRTARLQPIGRLRQEADTLYMLHWRAVENNLVGIDEERLVLPRVSFRRHAADWLIGTAEQWDEVSLDT